MVMEGQEKKSREEQEGHGLAWEGSDSQAARKQKQTPKTQNRGRAKTDVKATERVSRILSIDSVVAAAGLSLRPRAFFFLRLAVVLSWLDCVRSRGNETELLLSESTCRLVGQVEGRIGMVSRAPLLVEVDFGRGVEGRCDEKRQAGRGRNSFVFTLGVSHGNWTGLASLRRGRGPQFLGGVTGR